VEPRPGAARRLPTALVVALAAALPARGDEGGPSSAPPAGDAAPGWLGVGIDAGFPDGLAASATFRPWRPLRLDAGVAYNVLAFGLRAGATLVAPTGRVAPLLRVEVGHAFSADASGLAERFARLTPAERILLADVGYTYASAQLGAEFRTSRRSAVVVRAGLAYFSAPVHGFQAALQTTSPRSTADDASVHATAPTASVGFLLDLL